MSDRSRTWAARLARPGAILGVAAALFLGSIRLSNEELPRSAELIVGQLAFTAVYLAPFALALWALRWPSHSARIAAWAAAAVLAGAGALTAFSGVTFALLPAAALLAPAAPLAAIGAKPKELARATVLTAMLVAVGASSFWTLILMSEEERCWQRQRVEETGQWSDWEAVPGQRARGGSGGFESRCTSDAIAWHESAATLALLAMAGGVMGRLRGSPSASES